MNNPCFSRVICECAEDNPFSNLSAEAPDVDRFFALVHFAGDPPLGDSFAQLGCLTVCESTISQADADLCALRQAQQCVWDNPGFGGDWRTPPTIQRPNGSSVQIFSNHVQSCTTACPDGSPFTFTVGAGQILALSQAEADFLAVSYACQQAQLRQMCLTLEQSTCCQNAFLETRIAGTGLDPVNNWSIISGFVPTGMHFFGGDGVVGDHVFISGTPTTVGSFVFTVRVTRGDGLSQTKTFTMSVAAIITNATLPTASLGIAYSQTLQASGFTNPVSWSVIAGILPAGLSLNSSTGEISGTPTSQGNSALTIAITDANGGTCTKDFTLASTGLTPFAWWKMEEAGAADRVDVVNALHLKASPAGPGSAIGNGPGKVLLGAKETCTLGTDISLLHTITLPAISVDYSIGFELAFWTRWDSLANNVNYAVIFTLGVGGVYNSELDFLWNDSGAPNNLRLQLYDSTAALKLQLDVPFVPVLGAYYFVQFFYDGSDHKIGMQINRGAESKSASGFVLTGTPNDIYELDVQVANTDALPGTSSVSTDEFAIFTKKLSATEADFLFNSGSGRTYPF